MNIREAHAGDTEGIAALVHKCCAQREAWDRTRYELTTEMIREYKLWFGRTAEDPRSILLVAEEGGEIVGFLIGVVRRDLPIYRMVEYALIQEMWVEPEHQPAGAGRDLVAKAIKLFGEMGIRQLRVETPAPDESLRKMLESSGFRVCSIDLLKEIPPPAPRRKRAAGKGLL